MRWNAMECDGMRRNAMECNRLYCCQRFYTQPLVWDVQCADDTLSFKTANNFRQSNADAATYEIRSERGETLASRDFSFEVSNDVSRTDWLP